MTVKEIARFYKIPVERAFGNTGGYILEDVRRTKADATRRAKALRGDGLTRFARSPAEPGRPHDAGRALEPAAGRPPSPGRPALREDADPAQAEAEDPRPLAERPLAPARGCDR